MEYEIIDLKDWYRRADYEFFTDAGSQLYITVNVDISAARAYLKQKKQGLFVPLLFAVSACINDIPEFRTTNLRPAPGEEKIPVRFARVDPCFAVRSSEDRPINLLVKYDPCYAAFSDAVRSAIDGGRAMKENTFAPSQNYFIATYVDLPFSAMSMVSTKKMMDKPVVAWGRTNERGELPVTLNFHHAFVDGQHFEKFFALLGARLAEPESFFI